MSLFFGIIEVEIEEQHSGLGLCGLLNEHILKYCRAENSLAAARNPMQPKERPPYVYPTSICTALDEPRACLLGAVFQRFVVVRRWIWRIKPLNDFLMLAGCVS